MSLNLIIFIIDTSLKLLLLLDKFNYWYLKVTTKVFKYRYLLKSMKLQKQLSRKVGDKEYAKYVAVIPPEKIKELGWKDGEELESEIKDRKLILKKLKK